MTEKPTALRLADHLECNDASMEAQCEAAAELRRLHTANQELLYVVGRIAEIQNVHQAIRDIARAAIAKHGGDQ